VLFSETQPPSGIVDSIASLGSSGDVRGSKLMHVRLTDSASGGRYNPDFAPAVLGFEIFRVIEISYFNGSNPTKTPHTPSAGLSVPLISHFPIHHCAPY
jgi:hypothetical protein